MPLIRVIVRIMLLVFFLFSFSYGRFFISTVFFVLSILDIIMKKAGKVFLDLSIAFWLGIAMNPALVFYYETEKIRFHVLEDQYEKVVEENMPSLINDREWDFIDIKSRILCDTSIVCRKKNESVMILFISETAGNLTGYAYCSDERAFQMLDEFEYYDKINEHWSVFEMYPLKTDSDCYEEVT